MVTMYVVCVIDGESCTRIEGNKKFVKKIMYFHLPVKTMIDVP